MGCETYRNRQFACAVMSLTVSHCFQAHAKKSYIHLQTKRMDINFTTKKY